MDGKCRGRIGQIIFSRSFDSSEVADYLIPRGFLSEIFVLIGTRDWIIGINDAMS